MNWHGGIAPLGYDIIDKKYVINEQEASCVRLIYDMYNEGYSLTDIALKLNLKITLLLTIILLLIK